MLKRTGPSTLLWGIPNSRMIVSEKELFIFTLMDLLQRKDLNQSRAWPRMPISLHKIFNSLSTSTVSNAALRSRRSSTVAVFLSEAINKSFVNKRLNKLNKSLRHRSSI